MLQNYVDDAPAVCGFSQNVDATSTCAVDAYLDDTRFCTTYDASGGAIALPVYHSTRNVVGKVLSYDICIAGDFSSSSAIRAIVHNGSTSNSLLVDQSININSDSSVGVGFDVFYLSATTLIIRLRGKVNLSEPLETSATNVFSAVSVIGVGTGTVSISGHVRLNAKDEQTFNPLK